MKKTLRMGDLLHLDDSVKKRLVTMVDSKNLVMEGSYHSAPHQRGRDVGMAGEVCRHLQGLHLRRGPVSG